MYRKIIPYPERNDFVVVANARDCQYCSIAHQAMVLKYGLEYGSESAINERLRTNSA